MEVFDGLRAGLLTDRSQFYKDLAVPFYGANKPGAKVSQGVLEQFWLWSMQCGQQRVRVHQGVLRDRLHRRLEEDRRPAADDARRGRPDRSRQGLGRKTAGLMPGAQEIYYPGAPHGLTATHQDEINPDLLAFLRS